MKRSTGSSEVLGVRRPVAEGRRDLVLLDLEGELVVSCDPRDQVELVAHAPQEVERLEVSSFSLRSR